MVQLVLIFANLVLKLATGTSIGYLPSEGTNQTGDNTSVFLIRLKLVIVDHRAFLDALILVEESAGNTLDAVVRCKLAFSA